MTPLQDTVTSVHLQQVMSLVRGRCLAVCASLHAESAEEAPEPVNVNARPQHRPTNRNNMNKNKNVRLTFWGTLGKID